MLKISSARLSASTYRSKSVSDTEIWGWAYKEEVLVVINKADWSESSAAADGYSSLKVYSSPTRPVWSSIPTDAYCPCITAPL